MLSAAAAAWLSASPAAAQPPAPGNPYVVDGPTSQIPASGSGLGLSIARDGTGGLVYLKSVGGNLHVFVSRLAGGQFQSPIEVDSQLSGPSSQPVIAAGNGGVLLVGFINSGELYVVDENGNGQFASPLGLADGAENPAIAMSNFGKGYLAFATADGAGHDVRTAYYYSGSWALEAPPLNASPADDAGTGTGQPAVAAAGDGIAIVAWGEQGHIYTRRVWGTAASVVDEQADTAPGGCTEKSVGYPVVGAGGDSSYAQVAFRALLTCGGQQEYGVLMNRLQGSVYNGLTEADSLTPGTPNAADEPQMAVGENGAGWVTSTVSDNVFAASLGPNSAFSGTVDQINSITGSAPLYAAPAIAGQHANLIAWQQQPGSAITGDVRVRFAGDGVTLGPETVISSPSQGPTDAAGGFAAAGDISGDAAVAWLQGASNATQVVVGQLYQPPGRFAPNSSLSYVRTPQPVLSWSRPSGWGPMSYSLSVDGNQVGQTYSTSSQVPAPLPDGPHNWQVTATNPAGQQSLTPLSTVFVDTVAPTATIRQLTRAFAGAIVRVVVRSVDHPPAGQPGYDASGVAKVVIRWGDGTVVKLMRGRRFLAHVYRRAGRFRVMLTVTDRAGNVTRVVKYVKVRRRRGRASGGGHP